MEKIKYMLKRTSRIAFITVILLFSLIFKNFSSVAQVSNPPENMLFLLDNSGSMQKKDENGRFKIDAATEVVKRNIDNPNLLQTNMGLVEFGGKCTVDVLVKPSAGEVNRKNIKSKLTSIIRDPYTEGATPIVAAIDKALEILKTEKGTRRIILVSDGLPNCGQPNACSKVQEWGNELQKQGIEFEMEIIGYGVEQQNDQEFTCIDKLSDRYSYVKVNNEKDLEKEWKSALEKPKVPVPSQSPTSISSQTPTPTQTPKEDKTKANENPHWLQIVLALIGAVVAIVSSLAASGAFSKNKK